MAPCGSGAGVGVEAAAFFPDFLAEVFLAEAALVAPLVDLVGVEAAEADEADEAVEF